MLRGACGGGGGGGGGRTVGLKQLFERDVGGGGWVVVGGWSHNNDSKRKTATSKITALLTRIIPPKQRWENLSEHRLSNITELGTFMVYCKFPQP